MLKQYIVLPKVPEMSAGKLVSQGAHAAFMALENQRELVKDSSEWDNVDEWKKTGQCVIVCEVPSQVELIGMLAYCEQWGIPCHAYVDEGFTEVPMGTFTAFATGVIPEDKQIFFSQLKLFGAEEEGDEDESSKVI